MDTVFLCYLSVVIPESKLTIFQSVFSLLFLRLLKYSRKGISKINHPYLISLCCADLHSLSDRVSSDAASDGNALLLKVNVIPCQSTRFTDAKPGVVCYRNREKSRTVLSLKIIRDLKKLLVIDELNLVFRISLSKQISLLFPVMKYHILHRVECYVVFWKYCKSKAATHNCGE